MATVEKIKTEGEYIGFTEGIGYIYSLYNQLYAFGREGVIEITHMRFFL
ncbi:hypothetical protein ACIQ1D_18785 [Lysinibacillus xylanilyticus]